MKIIENVEVPAFKPVTIVLESQGEVDFLASLLWHTSISSEKVFKVELEKMSKAIKKYAAQTIRPESTIVFKENNV